MIYIIHSTFNLFLFIWCCLSFFHFSEYGICLIISLGVLSVSCHWFLYETSCWSYWGFIICGVHCMWWLTSPCFWNSLFCLCPFQADHDVSRKRNLWFYLSFTLLGSLVMQINNFIQIQDVFSHYFFIFLLFSLLTVLLGLQICVY